MELIRKYYLHGLVVALLLGLLFAVLGVYDTSHRPFYQRYVFWTSTMLVGIVSAGVLTPILIKRWLPKQNRYVQLFAISLLISVPITLVLAGYDDRHGADWSLLHWLLQYRHVLIISLIVMFGSYFVLKAQGYVDLPDASEERESPPLEHVVVGKFLRRLPVSYHTAKLYAVSSEDHYLRVYTDKGEALILMRLSDAIRELEPVPGMQTHRSWWVAKEAVVERQRKQGKQVLLLKSGMDVPVSRSFDKAVREAI